jgi:outer membrane murein-binding lipoprotein Lpp
MAESNTTTATGAEQKPGSRWLARARAALTTLWQRIGSGYEALRAKVFTWRNTGNRSAVTALAWFALAAVVLAVVLLNTCSDTPGPEQRPIAEQPAAVQINPLAELVDRIDELEAMVAELQEQMADLQALPPPSSSAQRKASAQPAGQGAAPAQPAAAAWGPTDLDRAIADFTPPTTFGATP